MLKKSFYLRSGAEAYSLAVLRAVETRQSFNIVLGLVVVVLISILISHIHAAPV